MIGINDRVAKSKDIAWQIIDGNAVVVTIPDTKIHTFNKMGTKIWLLLEKESKLNNIVDKLCSEYEVTRSHCEKSVIKFINDLIDKSMLIKL